MGIDKEGFVETLLMETVMRQSVRIRIISLLEEMPYRQNPMIRREPKKVLEDAGWVDRDGDGIREKDGEKLSIRWLTYPSRQELPLLAESAQATLKEIGIDVSNQQHGKS